jgi:ATP-dependent exoDNAse (exonuclease V) beta subunit
MLLDLQNKTLLPFKALVFEEKRHIYTLYGRRLPSVSKIVESYTEKFDANKKIGDKTLIELCAAKQTRIQGKEITTHELKHQWQTMSQDGCDLGHETHDYLEYYNGIKTPTTPQQKAGVKFLTWLLSQTFVNKDGKLERRYEILHRELRMFSWRFKFAGTADLIVADKMLRTILIVDYKTNKDLFKTYGRLKPPFDFLESHPYNKYQIQLSLYQLMFEEMTNIKVSDRMLVHLKADDTYESFLLENFVEDLTMDLSQAILTN